MISRRLLRIKVLQVVYAFSKKDKAAIMSAEKELFFSINKAYDLYHYLMLLITEVADYAETRIELARNKNIASFEDLNPNTRFINNRVVQQLRENTSLKKYIEEKSLSWVNEPELAKKLFNQLKDTEAYMKYMEADESTYQEDREIVIDLIVDHIATCEDLFQILEEKSIYWNDDVEFVLNMILKTVERFKEKNPLGGRLMPLFKNDEDRDFAKELFRKALVNQKEIEQLIHEFTTNWELDRIAFMDIVIMTLAISEILYFPSIPVKVSMNEFIEISKYYSTNKSSQFINGVLDKIVIHLKNENKIRKAGRGLIGEQ